MINLQILTKDLADVGVVHVGESLQDLPPLVLGPHHEGVHGPLDVGLAVVPAPRLPEHSCLCDAAPCVTPRKDTLFMPLIDTVIFHTFTLEMQDNAPMRMSPSFLLCLLGRGCIT